MTDLGTLGGTDSQGFGINDSGQVTGDSAYHAFLSSGGVMTDLGTLGGTLSQGFGINASGQVTGDSYTVGNAAYHAFLFSEGVMTDLGTLGGTHSKGYGINVSGQVTGYSYTASNTDQHAFLYSGGSMYDLNDLLSLGTTLYEARGINDSGQIVANGEDGHAYILTPGAVFAQVPEPGSLPLLVAALGSLAGFLRKKNGFSKSIFTLKAT